MKTYIVERTKHGQPKFTARNPDWYFWKSDYDGSWWKENSKKDGSRTAVGAFHELPLYIQKKAKFFK